MFKIDNANNTIVNQLGEVVAHIVHPIYATREELQRHFELKSIVALETREQIDELVEKLNQIEDQLGYVCRAAKGLYESKDEICDTMESLHVDLEV